MAIGMCSKSSSYVGCSVACNGMATSIVTALVRLEEAQGISRYYACAPDRDYSYVACYL